MSSTGMRPHFRQSSEIRLVQFNHIFMIQASQKIIFYHFGSADGPVLHTGYAICSFMQSHPSLIDGFSLAKLDCSLKRTEKVLLIYRQKSKVKATVDIFSISQTRKFGTISRVIIILLNTDLKNRRQQCHTNAFLMKSLPSFS